MEERNSDECPACLKLKGQKYHIQRGKDETTVCAEVFCSQKCFETWVLNLND